MNGKPWTQAAKEAQLFIVPIPAYAGIPLLFWIFIQTVWFFVIAMIVCGVLAYLRKKGRTVPWVIRKFKGWLRGGVVHARPVFYRRRMQTLGSYDLVELKGSGS